MSALEIITHPFSPATIQSLDVLQLLLADKRSEATRRAYRGDLTTFFLGDPTPEKVRAFLSLPNPQIALLLNRWKAEMITKGLAEATINRRLSAVRSLLKLGHRLGITATDGRGMVDGERVTTYRDTRGLVLQQMKRLLALPAKETEKDRRDRALLRLLLENALRRAEVTGLDVGDFEYAERRLRIRGKGRGTQKEPVTLSRAAADELLRYLAHRGTPSPTAPLFLNVSRDPGKRGDRLTPAGLYDLVQALGKKIGTPGLTPHKLRHSAITAALDATGGDVRRVQKLSRHAKIETLMRYDDNRTDFQGEVSAQLSALLGG